ncbi:25fb7284-b81c-4aff-a14a-737e9b187636-CDS [Sclerotinia trifoliorum]|uniref:25fb7284-b81c-4aff-a14a-737e9b187636-CDS n=1 Tax=Sclerotinia trifoliorum TaxID=28548 RepID=A0A8H2VNN0_9HELO|nr:25fb7284-b81c-4aff-a14a-737e9b187636-CDS [Sclerotinia trifoliorum]
MPTRAQLEEYASGVNEEVGKHFAYRAAIAIHDLICLSENEQRHDADLISVGKIFDFTPAPMMQERVRLSNYLLALDTVIPRYWAVRLQISCLEYADRCDIFRNQLNYLENSPNNGDSSKGEYEYLIRASAEARTKILGDINRARNFIVPDEQNALQWAFEIMAHQGPPEDLWFIKSLKNYYQISRPIMDGVSIEPSEFGDIDRDETWCVATGTWGPPSRLRPVRIVPSQVSTDEWGALFPITPYGKPYHPENGLMLDRQIAENYEACRISIIPSSRDHHGVMAWEIRVLDSNLLQCRHEELGCSFESLHTRPLEFLNLCKPRQDFMQFQFLLCLAISSGKNFGKERMDLEVSQGCRSWGLLIEGGGIFRVRKAVLQEMDQYSGRRLPGHHTSKISIMAPLLARIFNVEEPNED